MLHIKNRHVRFVRSHRLLGQALSTKRLWVRNDCMDTENLVSMTPDIYPDIHYKFKNKINLTLPPSLEKARKKNYISIKLTVRDVSAKADNEKFVWKLKKRIVLYIII